MATNYSTLATNYRSDPIDKNRASSDGGVLHCKSVTISIAAADADGDIYHLFAIPSNASIKHLWIYNDAITAGTSYDLGLYTTASTPVVVDVDAYGSAIDMSSARTSAPIDAAFEARNITGVAQRVHTDGGVTTDPSTHYWVSFTANTVGTAQGDITVICEYTE